MNQNLPVHMDTPEEKGTITYATEVIAIIVGVATAEVEGIASMAGTATISELISGRNKNLSRGVKVEVGAEEVAVDVTVVVDYGMPIQVVGRNVQENVRKSIETMTGLHVIKVDVHVQGVSFEKENKELQQGQEMARLQEADSAKQASADEAGVVVQAEVILTESDFAPEETDDMADDYADDLEAELNEEMADEPCACQAQDEDAAPAQAEEAPADADEQA